MDVEQDTTRDTQIASLRAFADWLEANPTAEIAVDAALDGGWRVVDWRADADALREQRRQLGGMWTKDGDDDYLRLTREVVPGVTYQLFTPRNAACQRVQVGEVERTIVEPDPEALAKVPMVTRTVVEPVYEWDCPQVVA